MVKFSELQPGSLIGMATMGGFGMGGMPGVVPMGAMGGPNNPNLMPIGGMGGGHMGGGSSMGGGGPGGPMGVNMGGPGGNMGGGMDRGGFGQQPPGAGMGPVGQLSGVGGGARKGDGVLNLRVLATREEVFYIHYTAS